MGETQVYKILDSIKLIESPGRANITLPGGTKYIISNALFFSKSRMNLLSFKDIIVMDITLR